MQTVDAHAHVFHRRLRFAATRRYAPVADAPLPDYLALLDRLGIEGGVLVQPSFLGYDNTFLLQCLTVANHRLRGVAVASPEYASEELDVLAASHVAAIRFNLIGRPVPDFNEPLWRRRLRRIAVAGLHVEVQCTARDVRFVLPPLLDEVEHVVLDHFGLPERSDADDPALRGVLEHASSRRLFVKASAPYRFLEATTDVSRLLARYVDAIGADRLMWGSDWPHTQFEDRGDALASLLAVERFFEMDEAARAAVVGETARALYGFERVAPTAADAAASLLGQA